MQESTAQPVRIEGQRILLNLNNGTFTVESGGGSMPRPASVGVLRMSTSSEALPMPSTTSRTLEGVRPASTVLPASGIIEVVPVPRAPRKNTTQYTETFSPAS